MIFLKEYQVLMWTFNDQRLHCRDAERVLGIGRKINKRGSQNLLGRFLDIGEFMTPVPLRKVRFEPVPVRVPGMIERNGILRPVGRPDPTRATTEQPVVAGTRPSSPITATPAQAAGKSAAAPGSGALKGDRGSSSAPDGGDMLARLAAAGRARASQLGGRS